MLIVPLFRSLVALNVNLRYPITFFSDGSPPINFHILPLNCLKFCSNIVLIKANFRAYFSTFISTLSLERQPKIYFDDLDHRIDAAICDITGTLGAREGQIKAVRRLVYDQEDTVLIAATGYGKSAVLYDFSALTKRITVQIVPLTKLCENQRDDIARNVKDSNPVWIDADTHLKV